MPASGSLLFEGEYKKPHVVIGALIHTHNMFTVKTFYRLEYEMLF
jgi:hypothetical protein